MASPLACSRGAETEATLNELHPTETSQLLIEDSIIDQPKPKQTKLNPCMLLIFCLVLFLVFLLNVLSMTILPRIRHHSRRHPYKFPSDFVWGTATSSYQIEGAVREDGRGPTIWDEFCEVNKDAPPHLNVLDGSSGEIACDHYHRVEQDVQLLKSLHFRAYRFSIAWSRILPSGTGPVNEAGVAFYSRLIDTLLANNITPWVTMYHWDLPTGLEGGWLNRSTVHAFSNYARVLFEKFGDRVHHWITINEAWTVAVNGYGTGIHAPGHISDTEVYIAGHHLLLAHAHAVEVFRSEFGGKHANRDWIGMANCGDYRYPRDPESKEDREAAERAMLFQWGWFVDPISKGDYPEVMREQLGDRLPRFTHQERALVKDSADFYGLNYYSSFRASDPEAPATYSGYWADIHVNFTSDPDWPHNDMGWNVVPDGLREMLLWIAHRYGNPSIYITENGSAEPEPDLHTAVADVKRKDYFEQHLRACAQAMEEANVNLGGYFAWSLMDNFEWQFGYQRRFGICRVDFETLERTPKSSAMFLRDTILANAGNLERSIPTQTSGKSRLLLQSSKPLQRQLPERVVVGYGSNYRAVKRAVVDGVNVVIWSFLDFRGSVDSQEEAIIEQERRNQQCRTPELKTNLNLTAVREVIQELHEAGYDETVHMFSVGGWNGAHLDPKLSATDWYIAFKEQVGDLFHGIDWDLEGNDDLNSPYNVFTLDCLNKMGAISQMAKADGYIVGMAPPQSYLDLIGGSARFSRLVNLTDFSRSWHSDFSYFGANVYAYLFERYGEWIDMVFMQFYESYSRASMTIHVERISPDAYLERYLESIDGDDLVGIVDFSDDPFTEMGRRTVRIPLSKLVLGLANGWADTADDKTLYIRPDQIQEAWVSLIAKGALPRGAGFWTIDEEGSNGVYFARELSRILGNRL